jgi:hypothetical protein
MVTTVEIQQRIEEADQARLRARVETATTIATLVESRTQARAELAKLEAMAAAQIEAAGAVMTVDELAKFTGIPLTELRVNGNGKVVPVRKTRAARVPKVQPTATAPIREEAAPQDVTAQ